MAKNYKSFLWAGLGGLLLALAYPGWSFNFGFLVWIGFVPLFYALTNQPRSRSFLTGFVAGLFYFLIVFRWLWSIYPLDTLEIQSKLVSLIIVFLIYIISSAGMALFWGLFGLVFSLAYSAEAASATKAGQFTVFRKIRSKLSTASQYLIIPAIFVLLEYVRSFGFGLLWAGSGTLFGPHWTLGNLAYALAGNGLTLKLSSYVGIYGICFLVILANFLFFKILAREKSSEVGLLPSLGNCPKMEAGLVVLMILLVSLGPKLITQKVSPQNKEIDFAVIQTNQPTKILPTPKETLDAFKEQLSLFKQAAEEHPESQLIVFPEASDFFKNLSLFLTNAQVQDYFANLFKEPRLIVAGARVVDADGRAYSRVFALDTQKDIISFYDKRLLTPQGEFLSYPTRLIVNLISKTKVSEFGALRELGIGKKEISTVNFRDQFSVAPLVCSELLSPGLTRQTTEGSDIIAGMASYGIFHGNNSLARQTLAAARFRAAENQKPLIAASNMGLSYAVNSSGNVDFVTPNQAPQILTGKVALNPQKSWYNKVGDAPVVLGCLVLTILFSLQLIVHNRRNKVLMSNY